MSEQFDHLPPRWLIRYVITDIGDLNGWFTALPLAVAAVLPVLPGVPWPTALLPLACGLALAGAKIYARLDSHRSSRDLAVWGAERVLRLIDESDFAPASHITPGTLALRDGLLRGAAELRRALAERDAARCKSLKSRCERDLALLELRWHGRIVTGAGRSGASSRDAEQTPAWERTAPTPLRSFEGRGDATVPVRLGLPGEMLLEFAPEPGVKGRVNVQDERRKKDPYGMRAFAPGVPVRRLYQPPSVYRRFGGVKSHGYLRVTCEGSWALRLLEPGAMLRFTVLAEGHGDEVLLYTGPPATLTVEATGSVTLTSLDGDLRPDGRIALEAPGSTPVSGPAPLVVRCESSWRLTAEPIDVEIAPPRDFDESVTGVGDEIVRYTGPTRLLTVRPPDGVDDFRLELLTQTLTPDALIFRRDHWNRHEKEATFLAHTGSLFRIGGTGEGWTLAPAPPDPLPVDPDPLPVDPLAPGAPGGSRTRVV
ncbi:hypothetical protein GCM10009678_93010 [Actinomadura kijaniata]|uniref:Uncharacterized protein n=1 Tax=Actinomadura namibiensis TaxID=182080 RepID=A0A7W3QM15_ACTNM|nr:hypothetical protein [Actinomadura namibiensis]MBA8952092.1 hypothetical protein [Actinomadura namibiensis]